MAQTYRFALFAPVLFAAALVAGLSAQPDHSLLADPLAQLLVPSRHGANIAAMGVALAGLLHAALGIAITRDPVGPGRMAGRLITALGLTCAVCALFFPMDLPGGDNTETGAAHIALVGLSALLTLTAAFLCYRNADCASERWLSGGAALAMISGGVFSGFCAALELPLAGLGELSTQLISQLWLATLAFCGLQRMRTGKLA